MGNLQKSKSKQLTTYGKMRKLTHKALQIEDTMRYHFIPSFLNLGTTGILGLLFVVGAALSLGEHFSRIPGSSHWKRVAPTPNHDWQLCISRWANVPGGRSKIITS